jgi:5'-methylthioadenosine phosphorylase
MKAKIGVIGGSGIYNIEGIKLVENVNVNTPFGKPSDNIAICEIDEKNVAFLPRHGKGHRYLPTEVPYKANIWALKKLGVEWIISISAVGSLKEDVKPREWVIPDQIIDRTKFRDQTFFGNGVVGHIPFSEPFCGILREKIINVLETKEVKIHNKGVYVCMEGPAFSTRAESFLYKSWGADVIGMTSIPEAKLSREAEISYSTIAMVTDYDCWKEEEEEVSVAMVIENMKSNVEHIKRYITDLVKSIDIKEISPFKNTVKNSVMTDKSLIPYDIKENLKVLYGDYFDG